MDFMLRPVDEKATSVITLEPTPGFVVKSRLITTEGRPNHLLKLQNGSKVFINICHHEKVPKPEIDFDAIVVYPLVMNNQWEIPIITSPVREDKDKKGALCYVWDCCINSVCMSWINEDLQLREILVEWCLEACEISDVVGICRDHIAFPKMKKKGDFIPHLEVRANELTSDYRKEIAKMAEKDDSSPSRILELRRNLLEEPEGLSGITDEELPPLMPAGRSSKPLIEEIDNLSIDSLKNDKPAIPKELPEPQFEVRMRKTKKADKYRLRIEIESQVHSASDLRLRYNSQQNALEVSNVNLTVYKEKKLQIPLPHIFTEADAAHLEALFTKADRKLTVFI
ncbi:hypothetical protein HG536_0E03220 [Torulaspora globosa]|uniref:PIH1 N-terminal domain-containing protein n=1 Tax=Torulaspora globosa TaxID=48254 RepID=A0A7G3ZIS5_9SACH|nr:uncharacterized protein HG536_0E03220 [Torulaspora globosa]QLL33411.1 hypothetical protein HG536_0E03220 [Torulaspora globosa]